MNFQVKVVSPPEYDAFIAAAALRRRTAAAVSARPTAPTPAGSSS